MKKLLKIVSFFFSHPLGRKKPLKALFRFFSWQVLSRIHFEFKKFKFINKTYLHISRGQTVATGNYYVGLLEFEEMAFVIHFLQEDDVFFDIGANIGAYSIIASGVSKSKSYAFEPVLETYKSLNKNILLNGLNDKICALNLGLAENPGVLFMTTSLDTTNHIVDDLDNSENKTEITVKTLNEFKDFLPSLIKIDVEGYEEFVLKGGLELLSQSTLTAIIIEFNNEHLRYNKSNQNVHDIIVSKGFRLYNYNPFNRELIEINNTKRNNRIYIKDLRFAEERIKTANPFIVFGMSI